MGRMKRSQARSQGEFVETAGEMHERLWSWRRGEPGASFDEIMERVRQEREGLLRPLVEELVGEAGDVDVDVCCSAWGGRAQNKGKKKKVIQHRDGRSGGKSRALLLPFVRARDFSPWIGVWG